MMGKSHQALANPTLQSFLPLGVKMDKRNSQGLSTITRACLPTLLIIFGVIFSAHVVSSERTPLIESRIELYEAWIDALMRTYDLPGISVGIVHHDKLVYKKGFGYSDLMEKSPATAETVYSVASISKLFTSIGIMQLVEREMISLDDPVVNFIPELGNLRSDANDIKSITIRSLLRHTSGLPTNNIYLLKPKSPVIDNLEKVLEGFDEQKLLHTPDTREHYSNLAMNLGGIVIQRVSKKEYGLYVKEEILDPLGMAASTFYDASVTNKAIGYSRNTPIGRIPNEFVQIGDAIGKPAAGLKSNIQDLARFAIWHFETLEGKPSSVIAAETLANMQSIHWAQLPIVLPSFLQSAANSMSNALDIGGVGLGYFRAGKFVRHSGGFNGFNAEFLMDNENKIGIVVLANSSDTPASWDAASSISLNLYEIVASAFINPVEPLSNSYSEYQRIYTDQHYFNFYAMPFEGGLTLFDLNSNKPLSSPIKLVPRDEPGSFHAPDHRGFYQREFNVQFLMDANSRVDSMILQNTVLYPSN